MVALVCLIFVPQRTSTKLDGCKFWIPWHNLTLQFYKSGQIEICLKNPMWALLEFVPTSWGGPVKISNWEDVISNFQNTSVTETLFICFILPRTTGKRI